jgi:hypothetical protein
VLWLYLRKLAIAFNADETLLSLSLSLSLSLTHTHTLSLCLSPSQSLFFSLSIYLSVSFSFFLPPPFPQVPFTPHNQLLFLRHAYFVVSQNLLSLQ